MENLRAARMVITDLAFSVWVVFVILLAVVLLGAYVAAWQRRRALRTNPEGPSPEVTRGVVQEPRGWERFFRFFGSWTW